MRQALARALSVPDHADAPVARCTARLSTGLVTVCRARKPGALRDCPLQLGRPQGLGDRHLDRMKLVVAGHLLDQRTAAVILEDEEVAQEREEAARRADAFQHHLQLGQVRIGQPVARDGAPGLEPFPPGGQSANPRLNPVRDHQGRVHGKQ